jgi:DNA-binding beta-propeller fold protein YncE
LSHKDIIMTNLPVTAQEAYREARAHLARNGDAVKPIVVTQPEARTGSAAAAAAAKAALRIVRDRIEFTFAFVESLKLNSLPAKSTLLFIAREIVVNAPSDFLSGIFLGDHHVILVADRLDARHGIWVLHEATAADGMVGASGANITLICRDLLGASAISIGGKGGPGKPGKNGKPGEENCEYHEDTGNVECEIGPGQDGTNGLPGAQGGNGGQITLMYINDLVPGGFTPSGLLSLPGGGGTGGAKGLGGAGDPNGKDGVKGSDGPAGVALPPQVIRAGSETDYWQRAISEAGPLLADWRAARLRAADFFFRAFRPTPDKQGFLGVAREQAQAVLQLHPTTSEAAQATRLRTHLDQQLNVLGLARDTRPMFIDFPRYQRELTEYEGVMRDNFRDAVGGLLEVQVTQTNVRRVLELQRDHLDSQLLKDQLQNEIKAAEAGRLQAATLLGDAEARRTKLQGQIKDLEFRMSAESPPGGIVLANTVVLGFGIVASLAVAFVATPAAGAAVASLMPLAADILANGATMKDMEASLKDAKDIAAVFKSKTDDAKKNAKGLHDLVGNPKQSEADWKEPAFKMAVSFAKVAIELGQAVASGDPRYAQLLAYKKELFVALHQEFLAKLASQQMAFTKKAAEAAEGLRVEDLEQVKKALADLNGQDLQIRRGVLAAVQHARSIRNRLLGLVFNAGRALDVYTLGYPPSSQTSVYVDLNSPSTLVAYDWGYVHPDDENAYLEGRLTHSEFQQKVRQSMGTLESFEYQTAYTHYREKRASRVLPGAVLTYPRPDRPAELQAALQSFKEEKRLFFVLTPDDVRAGRYEAKVTGLRLTLNGVTSPTSFGCLIRHNGRSQQRWLPSEQASPPVHEQVLPPALDAIELKPAGPAGVFTGAAMLTQPGEDQSLLLQSYGRGLAAEWAIELDPGSTGVDLAQLTGITIEIEYDSFLDPALAGMTVLQTVSHSTVALIPGASTPAALALAAPAPTGGSVVKLTSSDPAVVKVPGTVTVAAGAREAVIPLEIAATAGGRSAIVTATADISLRAALHVPAQTWAVFDVSPSGMAGHLESVNGVVCDETHTYLIHHFAKESAPGETPGPGELIRVRHSDFKEHGPRVKVGLQPRSLALNPNPAVNCLYVLNHNTTHGATLSIIDRATLKEVAGSPLSIGFGALDVAVNTKTNRVYVSNWGQHLIHVIAPEGPGKTHKIVGQIKAAAGEAPLTGLHGLAVDEARNRLFAARYFRSNTPHVHGVTVIDAGTNKVLHTITHPQVFAPVDVALNAAGTRLYTAQLGAPGIRMGVSVFDLQPTTAQAVFKAFVPTRSNAWAIAMDPGRELVYVTYEGGVHVIDDRALATTRPSLIATLPTGRAARRVAVNGSTGHILVGDGYEGTLTRFAVPEQTTTVVWS